MLFRSGKLFSAGSHIYNEGHNLGGENIKEQEANKLYQDIDDMIFDSRVTIPSDR